MLKLVTDERLTCSENSLIFISINLNLTILRQRRNYVLFYICEMSMECFHNTLRDHGCTGTRTSCLHGAVVVITFPWFCKRNYK